ncbi:MAG: hypothetical protein ACK5O2_15035 [Microthrixaceae bacterium]
MNEVLVEAEQGVGVQRSSTLLGDYLDDWMEGVDEDLRPTTVNGYRRAVKRLKSKMAFVKLWDLTPLEVEKAYRSMINDGLAPKTVRNTHTVLRRALADAERLGLIGRNVAAAARPPSPEHHEQDNWSALSSTRSWRRRSRNGSSLPSSLHRPRVCAEERCSACTGVTSTSTRGTSAPIHPLSRDAV